MSKIHRKIIQLVYLRGRGCVFTPKDFIGVGSRMAIDTTLSRLAAAGHIRRLARGLYDYPKRHRLLGDLYPSLDDVAKTIARDADSKLQISGANALHVLGLTTQVPAQIIYLTDGQSKNIQIGRATLVLKHASSKVMAASGSKVGMILQAIRYLGKSSLDDHFFKKITPQLNHQDKKILKHVMRFAPQWAKPAIDQLLAA